MSTTGSELISVFESETDTITDAVSSGRVTLEDLDAFVRSAERGEVDASDGLDAVVRILRSLLSGDAPSWEEKEPAGS